MKILSLSPSTLSASLERGVVAFTLGDGRRLAWRSQSPAEWIGADTVPMGEAIERARRFPPQRRRSKQSPRSLASDGNA